MAIRGSTFVNQEFTAQDHGGAFAASIIDGQLTARAAVTVSGKNVTLPKGLYCIGGRIIELTAAQVINIAATSGYARIKCKINLAATSTEASFQQVTFEVDTATSATGFAALVQEDITGAGVTYEAEMAVVHCGASHTLVRQIEMASTKRIVLNAVVAAADWSNNQATVTVDKLGADADPIITFDPDSYADWAGCGIRAISTDYHKVVLAADTTPSKTVKFLVVL